MSDTTRRINVLLLGGCLLALVAVASPRALAQVDTTGRSDSPETPVSPRRPYSPYSDPFPYSGYRHFVEFDSVTGQVRLSESVFGDTLGMPSTISLDQFLSERQREIERRMWDSVATAYDFRPADDRDELEKIIGKRTKIELPIPQNPIFSIFGTPKVSIEVNGAITVSAGWQWDNNNLTSISALGSTQSAPFFNQDIQVNVKGSVGEKLNLSADFQTGRTFDFDNQLKIGFGGGPESDDDIVQSVEAGNVQLTTPSTLIGGSQTLFGAKAAFKFGPLFLTTIASQKRGERKTLTVSGGSVKTQISLKPYDYAQNHFWLDTVYKRFYDDYYRSTPPAATTQMAAFNVVDIEVYEQVKDGSIPSQFPAVAYADLPARFGNRYDSLRNLRSNTITGEVQRGSFRKLNQGPDFEVDRQLGTIVIKLLQSDKAYAVAYRTRDAVYGELSSTRPDSTREAVLKLVYVSNMQPSFTSLWARQMKNIYPLQGARNINLQNSSIKITFGVPPDTNEVLRVEGSPRWVEVLGVDRVNSAQQPVPDGAFDITSPYFFDPARGEIIFPSTEPFRKRLRERLGGDAEPYVLDAIYDRTRDEAQRDTRVSRYTIGGEVSGSGGNKIQLGVWNVEPSSVKVTSNGEPLVEGADYRLDPAYGEVTLISPRANSATGNLQIEYEQKDFATIANKNLLGVRADYDLLNKRTLKSKLGMTFMRYGQSLPTDKVQITSGDESVTNLMLGFDGWVDYKADFVTKALDWLPIIDTKETSSFSLRGEWAMVNPNPNTTESLVASDGDRGVAYIDDFESGAKRQIQLGISYTSWHPTSAPLDPSVGASDSDRVRHKGHFFWYNRTPANTSTREIWPNKGTGLIDTKTSVLDLIFDPNRRGIYNPNLDYENNPAGSSFRDSTWGGMMRSLSFYAANLVEENIDYIEITMKADQLDPNAKMYIDLGQISEDVIPNFQLNTEDGITPDNRQLDDVLNEGEDVGYDGLNDDQERATFGTGEPDPSRDNYAFSAYGSDTPDDYRDVNGIEKNLGQERAPIPDAEDLNNNRSVDLDNSYFEYEVNLDQNPLTNKQIVGVSGKGWVQYRIPLRSDFKKVGNPSLSNVQFVRVRIKSPNRVRLRMAEFNLSGSDWRAYGLPADSARDPKLDIAFVNVEDNSQEPDFYTLPPGVTRERQAGSPEVELNEQSLSLHVRELKRGEQRTAVRVRPRSFDVFNYKEMKFFLHGDDDMDMSPLNGPAKVTAYVRFGWDSLNYYEYRVPLQRGWNEYTVNFSDLAAIKQARGTTGGLGVDFFPVPGQASHQFGLRGTPSLTRIQFIAFGIENSAYPGDLNTTMWVDEMRVVGAEDANDWAATFSAGAKWADLGTSSFNYSRFNPNFHRLEERFGNRVESTNWSFNQVVSLERFLPKDLRGSSIPFTYNHVERVEKPRYISESDVEVEAAARRLLEQSGVDPSTAQRSSDSLRSATETLVVQDAFSFSNIRLTFPGSGWAVRDILNRFTFGYDYNQIRERSPLVEQRFQWNWDFRGQYQVNIPQQNFSLQPFKTLFDGVPLLSFWKDLRFNFLPGTFSANTRVHRERMTEQLRNIPDPSPVVRDFRASRAAQFNWKLSDGGMINPSIEYGVDAQSSLTHLETDEFGRQREAKSIVGDLFFNEGRLFNFGRDNDLNQSITFNTQPRIPFIPGIERLVIPSAKYVVKYHWNDQLAQTTAPGSYTKSADWSSTATLGLEVRLADIGTRLFGSNLPGAARDSNESVLTTVLRYLIKYPFLDFNSIRFNFTQNNSSKNPGVIGATGVSNLWGRTLLFRSESPDFGPGAAYQLGLISDPHGKLDIGFMPAFPFIRVDKIEGIRAPNIYVQDNYSQKNALQANTDRPLWQDATISINWAVDWAMNQNYSVTTNGDGLVSRSNNLVTGNLSRTYLSLPDWLLFEGFNNDIDGVVEEYRRRKAEIPDVGPAPGPGATETEVNNYNLRLAAYNQLITETLSETFEQQLEALNWLPGEISRYLPRMNWTFLWNNLQKMPFLNGWAQSVSIRHAYVGRFNRTYRETDEGTTPEAQTVSRGFSPLVQVNVTGKQDVFKGTTSASLTYNTTSDFTLVTASRAEISKELKSELQAQVGYQRRGMKLPLFGLDLKNDIEFSMLFSYTRQNRKRFNLTDFTPEGNNDGSTRITFRPSIRYTLSNAVTASAFVSYEATIPDEEGSRDISRSTTKVGIDIRLGISGGR